MMKKLKPLAFPVILALYLVLGFYRLGFKSLGQNEAFSLRDAQGITEFNQARPLYYLLLRLWMHLGNSEFVLRSLSVLFGFLAVLALYLWARKYLDEKAALWSALLLASSTSHISASQQIRFYSLIALAAIIEMYAFLALCRQFSLPRLVLYWLTVFIGLLTSPTLIILNFAQLLFLLINYRQNRKTFFYFFASNALAALAGLPWWLFVRKQLAWFEGGWIKHEDIPTLFHYFNFLQILGKIVFASYLRRSGLLEERIGASVILIALVCIYFAARERKTGATTALLALWILAPIFALLVLSTFGIKLFHEKALHYLLPAYCLGLGYFLSRIPRIAQLTIILGIFVLNGLSFRNYYASDHGLTLNWRKVAQKVEAKTSGDQYPLVIYPGYKGLPFRYYSRSRPLIDFPHLIEPEPKAVREAFEQVFQPSSNYWVLIDTGGDGKLVCRMIREKATVWQEDLIDKNLLLLGITAGPKP